MPTHWHPTALFHDLPLQRPYALIILNQPINANALSAVIKHASLLICADGGANCLYDYDVSTTTPRNGERKIRHETRLPDAIIGDLDSLDATVEAHYRLCGVKVVNDPDQYSTDFTKCLKFVRQYAESSLSTLNHRGERVQDDTMDVVVLGGLGGRVDQGFSQIHHLFMAENDPSLLKGRIYLLSEQSLSFVLSASPSSSSTTDDNKNTNIIHLQPGYFAENVGILPILGRTLLTTSGLEWDVERWPTEFGGQVSTSNHIRADNIEIDFEGPRPLFTLELVKRLTAAGE